MFVQCNDNLTIAVAFELVFSGELVTIFLVTVEFTVDNGMNIILRVMERLIAIWAEVDDGESDVTKSWTLSTCGIEETIVECHTNATILTDPFSSSIGTTILHQFQTSFDFFFETWSFLPVICQMGIFLVVQASSESAHDVSWFSDTHMNEDDMTFHCFHIQSYTRCRSRASELFNSERGA